MKLVIISDTHGKIVKDLPDGDVLIHCGDYSKYGLYEETKTFFDWFSVQRHRHKIVITGNHEVAICPIKIFPGRDLILDLINSYSNVNFLVDKELIIDGVKFFGTPWCGGESYIMKRWGFYIEDDNKRSKIFEKIPKDTDVLITHTPPLHVLDNFGCNSLGCPALLERVMQVKPLVHLFGHIHSSNGHLFQNGIHFFNCSILDDNYQIRFYPKVVEIENKIVKHIN